MPTLDEQVINLLASPISQKHLLVDKQVLTTKDGSESYPFCQDIPWLFPDPSAAWGDWCAKTNQIEVSLEHEIQAIKASRQNKKTPSSTRERLKNIQKAKTLHKASIAKVLDVFSKNSYNINAKIAQSMWGKIPPQQQLLSYELNIYRDWAWSAEENQINMDLISKTIGENVQSDFSKTLFLGAGSCRLPIDFHQLFKPSLSVACDLNPYLLLSASKVLNREPLELAEFPHPARSVEDAVRIHSIALNEDVPLSTFANFHLLFCDALKPPFRPAAFDTIVTPWFIDIVQTDFKELAKIINRLLKPGGKWINLGPLLFDHCQAEHRYTYEEMKDVAKLQGLEIIQEQHLDMPYLHSPYSTHRRLERVYCSIAEKTKELTANKSKAAASHLPSWMVDSSISIPKLEYFSVFAGIHQIYAETVNYIDGESSIDQICEKMARKYQMPQEAMTESLKKFFITLIEENSEQLFRGIS